MQYISFDAHEHYTVACVEQRVLTQEAFDHEFASGRISTGVEDANKAGHEYSRPGDARRSGPKFGRPNLAFSCPGG